MPSTRIQAICLTAMSFQEFEKSMFGVLFVLGFFLMSCSFPNCKANFYFLEGALDALLCGNSSDAG